MSVPLRFVLRFLALALVLTPLLSCDTAPATAPEFTEPENLGPNASIIRSPVDGNAAGVDTASVANMQFTGGNEYRFGEVDEGEVVRHDFEFTNTGSKPLLITNARSTCGCTVPDYPEAPIAPGDKGVITVAFDTKNKYGRQRKPVTITANTYPATTVIYVDGTVINE